MNHFKMYIAFLLLIIINIFYTSVFAQGNVWKLGGNNNVAPGDFIGSTNDAPFAIGSGGNILMTFNPDGSIDFAPNATLNLPGTATLDTIISQYINTSSLFAAFASITDLNTNTITNTTSIGTNTLNASNVNTNTLKASSLLGTGEAFVKVSSDGTFQRFNLSNNPNEVLNGNGQFSLSPWSISGNDIFSSYSGNVGVGNSSPSEKLDVDGNIKSSANIHALGTLKTGNSITLDGTGSIAKISTSSDKLYFTSDMGEFKVGIGTNNPQKALHVRTDHFTSPPLGHMGIRLENHVTAQQIPVGTITESTWDIEPNVSQNPSLEFTLKSQTPLLSPTLSLTGSGLGIGISNPQANFHIDYTGSSDSKIFSITNQTYDLDKNVMMIKENGAMRIGNTQFSMYEQMAVVDIIPRTQPNLDMGNLWAAFIENPSYKAKALLVKGGSPTEMLPIFQVEANSDEASPPFHAGTNVRFVVNANGTVGIGTTDPQSLLGVNGDITCRGIEVTANGWPDFVFKKNYNLMPLYKVKEYINQEGHLPDVPSATQVLEDGVNLGEMDAILLKKVEELTLYILELQKEIDILKSK